MLFLERIAEERIQEAVNEGKLDNLALAGQPIELDDDSLVPPELRAGYRLLKNAGYLPPELALRREINDLSELLNWVEDPHERRRARARLDYLVGCLHARGNRGTDVRLEQAYYEKLLARLNRRGEPEPDDG